MATKRLAVSLLSQNRRSIITKRTSLHIVCIPPHTLSPSIACFNQVQRDLHSSNDAMNDNSTTIPTTYHFADIEDHLKLSSGTSRVLIDVRESDELLAYGTVPGSLNIPIISQPDAFSIGENDFKNRFGFDRPAKNMELIFFCRSGVRSLRAANLAIEAGWSKTGNYGGSWLDWEKRGGKIQLVKDN